VVSEKRRGGERPASLAQRRLSLTERAIVVVLFVVVISLLWRGTRSNRSAQRDRARPTGSAEGPRLSPEELRRLQRPGAGVDWWAVVAIAGGVVIAGGAAAVATGAVRRRRHTETVEADDDERARMLDAIDESMDALNAETDNRRAVIAAYARME